MLSIIATPIGHLADISERALEALRESDYILCEDTRHSRPLLQRYGIEKPLHAFHQFNEKKEEARILKDLEEGRRIALISDAGTPLISDPGRSLVKACIDRGLPFTAIPGPCSPIQALLLSGFDSSAFQFIGFLPRESGPRQKALRRALFYHGTTIAFESPQRLTATLEDLVKLDPEREAAVARELTKMHEECRRGKAGELLAHFEIVPPRGEIILLIKEKSMGGSDIDAAELVELLQESLGLSLKEAIKAAAKMKKMPKRSVYRQRLDQ